MTISPLFILLSSVKTKAFTLCYSFILLTNSGVFQITDSALATSCAYAEDVIYAAESNNVDPFILSALIYQESRWDEDATSPVGACGLTQVIPKYLHLKCSQLNNSPGLSIEAGAQVLSKYKTYAKGNVNKALQCYSTGYKCNYPSYAKRIIKLANKIKHQHNQVNLFFQGIVNYVY